VRMIGPWSWFVKVWILFEVSLLCMCEKEKVRGWFFLLWCGPGWCCIFNVNYGMIMRLFGIF